MVIFPFKKKAEEIKEIKKAITAPTPAPPKPPAPAPPKLAPLFVKIERYKEVLEQIQLIKATLENINSILRLRAELEKIRGDSEKLLSRQLDVCSSALGTLDKIFVRPEALEPFIVAKPERIEPDIESLSAQLRELSERLKKLT
jgi:chaperonin cofactor prefoldin